MHVSANSEGEHKKYVVQRRFSCISISCTFSQVVFQVERSYEGTRYASFVSNLKVPCVFLNTFLLLLYYTQFKAYYNVSSHKRT